MLSKDLIWRENRDGFHNASGTAETSCPDNKKKAVGRLKTERLALCLQPPAKMIGFSFVWLHTFGMERQAGRQAGQLTRQWYQSSVPIVMS